jgi:hypothetical protein
MTPNIIVFIQTSEQPCLVEASQAITSFEKRSSLLPSFQRFNAFRLVPLENEVLNNKQAYLHVSSQAEVNDILAGLKDED